MFKRNCRLAAVCSLLLLGGCITVGSEVPAPGAMAKDVVGLRLTEAADRTSRAFARLAEVETSLRHPAPSEEKSCGKFCGSYDFPPELTRPITIRWTGPVEPLLNQIADEMGYRIVVRGNPPQAPVTVTLDGQTLPVHAVIESTALQIARFATIAVNPANRTIFLRFGQ